MNSLRRCLLANAPALWAQWYPAINPLVSMRLASVGITHTCTLWPCLIVDATFVNAL